MSTESREFSELHRLRDNLAAEMSACENALAGSWNRWRHDTYRRVVDELDVALAYSRAQDSGGEAVCHECRLSLTGMCHKCAAEMDREMYDDFAAEQGDLKIDNPKGSPAKGDVPLCEKYGDGCNFPDCPCDVDDPLTQQPFKGECFADALDEDIKEARTPQPSDAQQASRASNPADAVCDCGSNVDNRQPHHDECAIYATPPTAQRHDEATDTCRCGAPCRKEVLMRGGDNGWGDDASRTVLRYVPPHGANCQSAKADGGAVAPAAVEAVAWRKRVRGTMGPWVYDIAPTSNPDIECQPLYTAPPQQRSEQVAVSAAVVARALVECPISLVAESRWEWIAKYINTALSKQVAGGGGVDIRKATSGIFKVLAELLHGGQTDSEFEQDVIQRPYVLDRVVAIRQHVDEIWAAISTQPLLSDQPAGVSAAVRACVSDLKRELSETDASHRLRAGTVRYYINKLEAALHPEQAKDGAAG